MSSRSASIVGLLFTATVIILFHWAWTLDHRDAPAPPKQIPKPQPQEASFDPFQDDPNQAIETIIPAPKTPKFEYELEDDIDAHINKPRTNVPDVEDLE